MRSSAIGWEGLGLAISPSPEIEAAAHSLLAMAFDEDESIFLLGLR
jgi:hypothetical protein